MVGKLFKYEIKSYLRLFIPFEIIVLASALFLRTVYIFQADNVFYDIIYGSSALLFLVAVEASLVVVTVLAIIRFFKNLYSSEGYLSFTLPVTASQHIFVKLATALLFQSVAIAVAVCAFGIATAGELFIEIVKAGAYLLKRAVFMVGANLPFYIVEVMLLLFASSVFGIMLFYTCISLGQLAKKARLFMAFVYYFIYYGVTQAITTIGLIIFEVAIISYDISEILFFIESNLDWLMHIFLIGGAIFSLGISAILFVINKNIMTNKLNLE